MRQSFNLPVEPTAKGRPRVVRTVAGHSRTYTPDKTVDAEERIRWHLRAEKAWAWPTGTALEVSMVFYCRRPKTLPKRARFHTKKPDLDQFIKLVLDACNGILFADDSQVTAIRALKCYAPGEPCIVLTVEETE